MRRGGAPVVSTGRTPSSSVAQGSRQTVAPSVSGPSTATTSRPATGAMTLELDRWRRSQVQLVLPSHVTVEEEGPARPHAARFQSSRRGGQEARARTYLHGGWPCRLARRGCPSGTRAEARAEPRPGRSHQRRMHPASPEPCRSALELSSRLAGTFRGLELPGRQMVRLSPVRQGASSSARRTGPETGGCGFAVPLRRARATRVKSTGWPLRFQQHRPSVSTRNNVVSALVFAFSPTRSRCQKPDR
jgi:hypothetical protein